jgi:hypothetical protein
VGFIRMNEVNLALAHQPSNLPCSRKAPPLGIGNMHWHANFDCARGKMRISDRNQFGSVTPFAQSLQEEERLVLPAAIVAAKIDDERAHAQASPGFGQDRRARVSPASKRPSLRYLK